MKRKPRLPPVATDDEEPPRGETVARIILAACLIGLTLLFGGLTARMLLVGDSAESARATSGGQNDEQDKSVIKLERVAPAASPPSGNAAPAGPGDKPAEPGTEP